MQTFPLYLKYMSMYFYILIGFIERHKLLCKEQYGFFMVSNTTDTIVDFVTKAINALHEKYNVVGVF